MNDTKTLLNSIRPSLPHYRVWLTLCYNCPKHITDPAKEYCDRIKQFNAWLHDRVIQGDFSSWLTAYEVRMNNPILKEKARLATEAMKLKAIKQQEAREARKAAKKAIKQDIRAWFAGKLNTA